MKKSTKQLYTLATTALIGLTIFSGCGKSEDGPEEEPEGKVGVENLLKNVQGKELDGEQDLPDSFLQSNANFSFDLFKKLASEENAVFSPVPVYASLALIANGAEDQAHNEILEALNLEDLNAEEINAYYHELMKRLESEQENIDLTLSNSIWFDDHFEEKVDFLETNKTYYEADSFKINFMDQNTPVVMNDWIDDQTNGKIEVMVDEIDMDAVMYLFSTIYFDAEWEMPFKASESYGSEFFAEAETLEVDKMTGRFNLETVLTADEEGVILPYEAEEYSFVALMPSEGTKVRDYLNDFDQEKMIELSKEIKEEEVDLLLPKFEVNFENLLNDPLKEMGIQEMFDLGSNSLSKMGESEGNLFVSKIFQKTYLVVDEEGTEAASAVGTEIATTSMPVEKRVIDFNRPFLYGIIDNETDLPIFLGIMDHPGK